MTDLRAKYVPPAIDQLAFNCPHCGALAKQYWFTVHAVEMRKDSKPLRLTEENLKGINLDHVEDADKREEIKKTNEKIAKGRPFIVREKEICTVHAHNLSIASCFNCNEISIWIGNALAWPYGGDAPLPNPDLPDDVREDYEEASRILGLSPRGAAALLRLGIQKLCKHLGEKGKNIDEDIAALVRKGLDPRVQKALDVVRVIGNNAVHPGQIDLRDDRTIAEKLFGLVNLIGEIMITQPKHIEAVYNSLPESALRAIERRDRQPRNDAK